MIVRSGQEGFTSVRASKDQSNPFDSRAQAETSNIFQRTSSIDVTIRCPVQTRALPIGENFDDPFEETRTNSLWAASKMAAVHPFWCIV